MTKRTWMLGLAVAALPLVAARAEPDKKTERLWKAKCATCHGVDGKGQTDQGRKMGMADLTTAAWQQSLTDEQVKKAINTGLKREKGGKAQEMDPFAEKLEVAQIETLAAYVRTLK